MSKIDPQAMMDVAFQISRHMRQRLQEDGDDHSKLAEKTSPYQTFALGVLAHSATTTSELAEQMGITVPSATSLIDRLVKNSWVIREPDTHDRRIVRLRVTPEGSAICEKMKKKRLKMFHVLLGAMSETDQATLHRILRDVQATLEREKGE